MTGIYRDLVEAKLALWRAKRDGDPEKIQEAWDRIDMLLEAIFERFAEL